MISPLKKKRVWTPTGINIYKKSDERLKEHIATTSFDFYGQAARQLQVEAVFNLAQGRNTFLLAGTSFGKSWIPEIYYKLIPQNRWAVVLKLNPLDSLGDNQVEEKIKANFTAINLTKKNFTKQATDEILKGKYQFVYLSPEIFLNSKLWDINFTLVQVIKTRYLVSKILLRENSP